MSLVAQGGVTITTKSARREDVKHFLRRCRERLSPDDVGLSSAGRRHTPGLRREEVAVLAGVSASWYTWLEQGRSIGVSDSVLDSISSVLQLSRAERDHLFRLAGMEPQPNVRGAESPDAHWLQRIVDGWSPAPAYVLDRRWNVVVTNRAAAADLGIDDAVENLLVALFTDAALAARYDDWPDLARMLVGQYRAHSARLVDDELVLLTRQLCDKNDHFRELWESHEVCDGTFPVTVRVPGSSPRTYDLMRLELPEGDHFSLVTHIP